MINELIIVLILLTAFPLGYLLAYLCRDELRDGRKYFVVLAILSLILSFVVAFLNSQVKFVIILTLFYIAIVSLISVWKSHDRKFLK